MSGHRVALFLPRWRESRGAPGRSASPGTSHSGPGWSIPRYGVVQFCPLRFCRTFLYSFPLFLGGGHVGGLAGRLTTTALQRRPGVLLDTMPTLKLLAQSGDA